MNMTNFKILHLIVVAVVMLHTTGCATKEQTAPKSIYEIENLSKVDEKLYRSSQPSALEFQTLKTYGIQNVIDLRQWHNDKAKIQGTKLHYYEFPLNASKVTYEDLVKIVATIDTLNGKTLVHCLHGSDRTGVVVAAYRIGIQNWSKSRAIEEFTQKKYGYHKFWFSNLEDLLSSIDEAQFRADIQKYKQQLQGE